MAGILDRKNRIIDFILTPEGYKQMALHDIRFKYATFSDNSSMYFSDENNNFLSGAHNLRFEATNNLKDLINPEIDLNRGGIYDLPLNLDNSFVSAADLLSINDNSQTFLTASSKLHKRIEENLKDKNILLTTGSLDLEEIKFLSDEKLSFPKTFFIEKESDEEGNTYPTLVKRNINLSEFDLIKDDARFANKTNFLYLPPENIDGSPLGDYINIQQNISKVLVKNSVNNIEDIDNAINLSINQLESNNSIQKEEFLLTKKKNNSNYIFQIYNADSDKNSLEKLSIVDHGDIMYINRLGQKKFRRVFSAGKIFRIEKNEIEPGFLQSDQQIKIKSYFGFANIFTIIFEE